MEVSSNFCNFLCIGALYDFESPMVSTSSGLGMDGDCSYWGLFKALIFIVLVLVTFFTLFFFLIDHYDISKANSFLFRFAFQIVKFFVIGHDCAHKSFSKNKLLEDIVGTLAFLPLIYPYEPWRFKHDRHHAKTNMSVCF